MKQKVSNLVLAKEFVALVEDSAGIIDYRRRAMAGHRTSFGVACHQNVCYYPEFFDGGVV